MATKAFSCGTRLTFRWFKFSEPRLSIQRRDSLRLDVTHQSWTHLTCTGVQYLYPDRLTDRCIYSRFRQHVSHSNDSCDRRRHGFYRCRYFHLWSLNGCSLAHQRTHYSTAHNSHRHVQWATHAWCTFTEYKPHFRSIDSYLFFTFQCYSCVMSLYSCLWHIAWRHAELLQISFIMTSIVIGLFVNSVERVCGLDFTLVMTCLGICTLTIFVPEQMLACITSNGLNLLVFLLTDLLFLRHQTSSWILRTCLAPRLEEVLNRSEWGDWGDPLFTLFIQWQCLCHTGWRCSMLSFRLFQTGATHFAVIFFRKSLNLSKCIHHLLPPPRDTEITSWLIKATL